MNPQMEQILKGTETTRINLEGLEQHLQLPLIFTQAAKQLGMSIESLNQLMQDKHVDRMLGSMFGAFLGDALGSYCEFERKASCTKVSKETMQMPGGGTFQLLPGQVTDDSEMALHMLQALVNYDPKVSIETQLPKLTLSIAKQYVQWLQNIPFDIGITTRSALAQLEHYLAHSTTLERDTKNLHTAFAEIQRHNERSMSNGFLMRITPMACFITLLTMQDKQNLKFIPELIKNEVNMTHSNNTCINAASLYMDLIRSMILREQHQDIDKIYNNIKDKFKNTSNDNIIGTAIQQAFIVHEQQGKGIYPADGRDAGFFKIAYFYTFFAFRQIAINCKTQKQLTSQLYKNILQFTISQGGDTDTNACIVGGLVGAIIGFKNLPTEYLIKQLNLKLGQSEYRQNQRTYEPINGFINLIKLIRKFK